MHFFDSFIISKNVKACKKIQNIFLNSPILEAENCVLLLCLEMRDAEMGHFKRRYSFGVLVLEGQHGIKFWGSDSGEATWCRNQL